MFNKIAKRLALKKILIKKAENNEKFSLKEMDFLNYVLQQGSVSHEDIEKIGANLNDNVIKFGPEIIDAGYGGIVLAAFAYVANNVLTSFEKIQRLVWYIQYRKTTVTDDQIYFFGELNKNRNIDILNKNNFINYYLGGVETHIYNSCKMGIHDEDSNFLMEMTNSYFPNLSSGDHNLLVDMGYCYMLGADNEHIQFMYDFGKAYPNDKKKTYRYVRSLSAENEDMPLLETIYENADNNEGVYELLDYYKNDKNEYSKIIKDIKNGYDLDDALTNIQYLYNDKDNDKYLLDTDEYINEMDQYEDEHGKDFSYTDFRLSKNKTNKRTKLSKNRIDKRRKSSRKLFV